MSHHPLEPIVWTIFAAVVIVGLKMFATELWRFMKKLRGR